MEETSIKLLKNISSNTTGTARLTVNLHSLAASVGTDVNSINTALVELEEGRYIDTWRTTEKATEPFLMAMTEKGHEYLSAN